MNVHNGSKLSIVALIIASVHGSILKAETIQDVETKLVEMWEKIESLQAKLEATDDMPTRDGLLKTRAVGTYEYLNRDGKRRFRVDLHSSTINYIKGLDARMEADIVSINDGQFVYTFSDEMGAKNVMKTKPEPAQNFDRAQSLETLRKDHELTLQDDQVVDGEDAYVIKAKSTNRKTFLDRKFHYYSKRTGVLLKSVTYNNDDQVVSTTRFTEIAINMSIGEDRFVFKAPAGIAITDLTSGLKSK